MNRMDRIRQDLFILLIQSILLILSKTFGEAA